MVLSFSLQPPSHCAKYFSRIYPALVLFPYSPPQRSLGEKAELTKRLEDIEGSLLEREATFDQLQRLHAAAEASVAAGLQRAEAERRRIATLTQQCQELDQERKKLQTACEQHQNSIKVSLKLNINHNCSILINLFQLLS